MKKDLENINDYIETLYDLKDSTYDVLKKQINIIDNEIHKLTKLQSNSVSNDNILTLRQTMLKDPTLDLYYDDFRGIDDTLHIRCKPGVWEWLLANKINYPKITQELDDSEWSGGEKFIEIPEAYEEVNFTQHEDMVRNIIYLLKQSGYWYDDIAIRFEDGDFYPGQNTNGCLGLPTIACNDELFNDIMNDTRIVDDLTNLLNDYGYRYETEEDELNLVLKPLYKHIPYKLSLTYIDSNNVPVEIPDAYDVLKDFTLKRSFIDKLNKEYDIKYDLPLEYNSHVIDNSYTTTHKLSDEITRLEYYFIPSTINEEHEEYEDTHIISIPITCGDKTYNVNVDFCCVEYDDYREYVWSSIYNWGHEFLKTKQLKVINLA